MVVLDAVLTALQQYVQGSEIWGTIDYEQPDAKADVWDKLKIDLLRLRCSNIFTALRPNTRGDSSAVS